ncbi:hypothetical protein O181_116340, partial [Austropuccinia psidii MF-1]|nr:hypothetical protein [Austropuccinia psidii MF-1]
LEYQRPPHVLTQIPLHGSTVGSRTPTIPNLNYCQFLQYEGFPSETIFPFLTNIPRDFLFHPSSPNPPRHSPAKPHNMTGEDGSFDIESPDVSSGVAYPLLENAETPIDKKKEAQSSSVYIFYLALDANETWDPIKDISRFTYRCNHCTRSISVIGHNTSNLNKYRSHCPGQCKPLVPLILNTNLRWPLMKCNANNSRWLNALSQLSSHLPFLKMLYSDRS